jgi:hypothetical protein
MRGCGFLESECRLGSGEVFEGEQVELTLCYVSIVCAFFFVDSCSSDGQDGEGIESFAFNGTFSDRSVVPAGDYRRECRPPLVSSLSLTVFCGDGN